MEHVIELQPFMVPNFARPVVPPGKRQRAIYYTMQPLPCSRLRRNRAGRRAADGISKHNGTPPICK